MPYERSRPGQPLTEWEARLAAGPDYDDDTFEPDPDPYTDPYAYDARPTRPARRMADVYGWPPHTNGGW